MSSLIRKHLLYFSDDIPQTSDEIYEIINKKYIIKYVGVYYKKDKDKFCLYIQTVTALSPSKLLLLLQKSDIKVESVERFKKYEGEMITECGEKPVYQGYKRKNNTQIINNITNNNIINNNIQNIQNNNITNNINVIVVNPVGQESIEHITADYIKDLLGNHDLKEQTLFVFGAKLYSVPENMNFIAKRKDGYLKALVQGDNEPWVTRSKAEGFDDLVDNLVEKNREAVELHKEGIPQDEILMFDQYMNFADAFRNSPYEEDRKRYRKFRNTNMNCLSENIADKKRRLNLEN